MKLDCIQPPAGPGWAPVPAICCSKPLWHAPGVTLNAVATALGIGIREGTILAEGDLDFRGTLGVAKDVPVGFQRIRLRFELITDAAEDQLATLVRLTERYCVVYQTLRQSPETSVSMVRTQVAG